MENDIAIKVDKIYKDFHLPHKQAPSTIKSYFTSIFKRSGKSEDSADTQHALKDISLEIQKGEFFGIVGRNGSGKSTLLKILAEIYQPTKGSVSVKGRLVPFIELGVGFNPELTGRENVYLNGAILGFTTKQIDDMYKSIVRFSELEDFMDQKLKNYSSGMQVRLAFSCATMAEADILLIDEVLAVGDIAFQRKCFEYFRYLKKQKKTVVFVSHDMSAIREYCDRAVLIEKSKIIKSGSPENVAREYNRLFVDDAKQNKEKAESKKIRWGNSAMEFIDVYSAPKTISNEDNFEINFTIKVNEKVENPVIGFSIKNSADIRILGSNTKLQEMSLGKLKPGQKIKINWTIPNILNDGDFYVNAAIESEDAEAYDWWEEALKFSVIRSSQTGFAVHPKINLKISEN